MSLLREIQEAAIDSNVELAVVLRKAKVLAARLGHKAFKTWVDQELNGYASTDEVPDYRVLNVQSKGNFVGSFSSQLNNTPIPPSSLPKKYRDMATTHRIPDGVSALESLVHVNTSGTLQGPWPYDLLRIVGTDIYTGMNLISAWKVIPTSTLVGILDTVRNRILSFALEIESEAPEIGEVQPGTQPIPADKVTQIFNTYVQGGTNIVALAGSDITQTIDQSIHVNDLESLKIYLKTLDLADEDIQELEDAIEEDGPPPTSGPLGKNVASWIGKMTGNAVAGVWKVTISAAADILSKSVRDYYGLS